MKKYIKSAVLVFTVLIFSLTNGCDAFDSFPLNMPFTITFTASGNSSTITDNGSGCLDTNSETYQEYRDKINSLTFVEAAYRTVSVNTGNQNITADISVIVSIPGGATLFNYTIPNVRPADFISTPLVLQLDQVELDAIRSYLELFQQVPSMCFDATYTLSNISGGAAPYTVEGAVDFVLEAETEF
ncbi:MAG: hypothetical protein IPM56_15640 [Ignavibacteriales bacterium]|nr:MAG: hypothetical protein IPM56_15640 [Ignavibacteriales bacterium]